jgi:hypothetical protein
MLKEANLRVVKNAQLSINYEPGNKYENREVSLYELVCHECGNIETGQT